MRDKLVQVADNFWNIRGSFKIAGLVDIGTQASLAKLSDGGFVFLDSYPLRGEIEAQLNDLTKNGEAVTAILNLHPFHTVHVRSMQERYPHASHYGTARHHKLFPELAWQECRTEDSKLHEQFADDFDFSIPRGVDFISSNDKIHFSSVLALHRDSQTLHVDDTIMHIRFPMGLRLFGHKTTTSFHPTLAKALERRSGAAQDFREWAEEMIEQWSDVKNLCAAHTAPLWAEDDSEQSIPERLHKALRKVGKVLNKHERKYG